MPLSLAILFAAGDAGTLSLTRVEASGGSPPHPSPLPEGEGDSHPFPLAEAEEDRSPVSFR